MSSWNPSKSLSANNSEILVIVTSDIYMDTKNTMNTCIIREHIEVWNTLQKLTKTANTIKVLQSLFFITRLESENWQASQVHPVL